MKSSTQSKERGIFVIKLSEFLLCENLFSKIPAQLSELFRGVKYPWEVLSGLRDYIKNYLPKSGLVEIFPDVFAAPNVKIASGAEIAGPTVILSGAEIRHGAYIRGSAFIGEECVVGNSTEIKNSLLFCRAQAPHYNYVGDSILGTHTHMGAGSVASNLKSTGTPVIVKPYRATSGNAKDLGKTIGEDIALPQGEPIETGLRKLGAILADGADVGCGCVLNPGTVIGKNSIVYPMSCVRGVIPEEVILKGEGKLVKKK